MPDGMTLSRSEPTNPGLDYAGLRDRGQTLVQELAGQIWTDYNEHDPGVTILEQLCYALTDLSYRAGFPVTDLLAGAGGVIDPARQALFPARDVFPVNPLTPSDYRRLIADRVPAVGNVWISPRAPAGGVSGLYDVALYVPGCDPCSCEDPIAPADVRGEVVRVYARHRNLCEDLHSVRVLDPVRAVVRAHVSVDDSRAPEAILAELLFNVGLLLAPELRREPLSAQLARGLSPSQIFTGPLLHDGFVGDDQLKAPRPTSIRVPDIARVLARTSGVLGVRDVSIRTDATGEVSRNAAAAVPRSAILALETRPGNGGDFSVRLLRRGAPCKVDPARVRRELDRLWNEQRRRYPLSVQYDKSFAMPSGAVRSLAGYSSIQNQFPNVYGINAYGPPDEATTLRLAQAKQLKGYLLVFEQLLTDFFAQLGRAKDLLSIDRTLAQTYFHQSLRGSVPDVGPLLDAGYEQQLDAALRSADPVVDRRNRFLDVLLALQGNRLDAPPASSDPGGDGHAGEHLVRAKIALLEHLVASTRDRGRGCDTKAAPFAREFAGMEIRSRIELGLDVAGHRSLLECLEEAGVELVEESAGASIGRLLGALSDVVEATLHPVTAVIEERAVPVAPPSAGQPASLRRHTVTESLLGTASTLDNFHVGTLPDESEVSLFCKAPGDEQARLLGRYADLEAAALAAVEICELLRALSRRCQQLYIVEHTLLRFGRRLRGRHHRHHRHEPPPAFACSFTVSAVLSRPPGAEGGDAFEQMARDIVRRNAPAHVAVEYCFLRPAQMRRFEELHRSWREALHHGNCRAIVHASVRLRTFLEQRSKPE